MDCEHSKVGNRLLNIYTTDFLRAFIINKFPSFVRALRSLKQIADYFFDGHVADGFAKEKSHHGFGTNAL